MDSPRLDVTHLLVVHENEVVEVTRKPTFFWVDLTTKPGIALAYEVDTKRCWDSSNFDASRAVLRSQIPRPWPIDYFNAHFQPSEGMKKGQSGTYVHTLGVHLAVKMKHPFCSHNSDLSRSMEGAKGDWLVFNGEVNIPVSENSFEHAFVRVGSYPANFSVKEPQWERDSLGMPVVGRRAEAIMSRNVISFPTRSIGRQVDRSNSLEM